MIKQDFRQKIHKSRKQTLNGLLNNLPIILGVILLLALFQKYISFDFLTQMQNHHFAVLLANVL
ncbi:MAG: hypothetical protein GXP45_02570 [bacterium]|nr:hypothetical protein [bacterium]